MNRTSRTAGFSLVEVLIVVALIAVVAAMAIPVSTGMIARARADSASATALTWLESARNRAVAERRNFEVTFDTAGSRIVIERVEPDLSTTPILDRELEQDLTFMQFEGAPDTPDLFGRENDVELDGPAPHMFTSEGSFIDANGDPSNGTVFMGRPDDPLTGRAITIFGVTGLLRSWQLAGAQWHQ